MQLHSLPFAPSHTLKAITHNGALACVAAIGKLLAQAVDIAYTRDTLRNVILGLVECARRPLSVFQHGLASKVVLS